jgi:transposase
MSDLESSGLDTLSDTELLHTSKAEPVRRLEVFTGAGRRRAWSAEQKERIVAESYESGETVSAVARRHALTPQQLFGWRRAARRWTDDESSARAPAFAPVIVEAAACAGRPIGTVSVEIVIGAATVRVLPGIDAVTLTTVLRAVRAAT